jgi:hypothetical protein
VTTTCSISGFLTCLDLQATLNHFFAGQLFPGKGHLLNILGEALLPTLPLAFCLKISWHLWSASF